MSPADRANVKLAARFGFRPVDPAERAKLEEVIEFVPEAQDGLTFEEARAPSTDNKWLDRNRRPVRLPKFDPSTAVLQSPTPTP